MPGKISGAMERALAAVDAATTDGGMTRTITEIAAEAGLDVSSLRRAMRRVGYDPQKPVPGTVIRSARSQTAC